MPAICSGMDRQTGTLWLFGVLAVPAGLGLWHQQGRHFGLGPEPDGVRPAVAATVAIACALLLILELAIGWAMRPKASPTIFRLRLIGGGTAGCTIGVRVTI